MKHLLLLSALFCATALPVHAMTEESSHYQGTSQRAQYADPDDAEESFNDTPHSYYGQSGREQELLQGGGDSHPQTYGFSNYDNGWTQSRGTSGSQSGLYYGLH